MAFAACTALARRHTHAVTMPCMAILLLLAVCARQPALADDRGGRVVAGWVERAWFGWPPSAVIAKLDTGADSSAIGAVDIAEFSNQGKRWLRFTISGEDGKPVQLQAPIVRWVKIRRAGAEKESRAVVRLVVCVAGKTASADFTLADRSGMDYQVLIGRSFLVGRILVDSSRTMIAPGGCGPV